MIHTYDWRERSMRVDGERGGRAGDDRERMEVWENNVLYILAILRV